MTSPNVLLSEALQLEVGGKLHIWLNEWHISNEMYFLKSFLANEPWPADVKLFQPFEVEQVLIHDNSNILAVQGFLNMCNLEYTIEMRANAEHMSPSGMK